MNKPDIDGHIPPDGWCTVGPLWFEGIRDGTTVWLFWSDGTTAWSWWAFGARPHPRRNYVLYSEAAPIAVGWLSGSGTAPPAWHEIPLRDVGI